MTESAGPRWDPLLRRRVPSLRERMEDPSCDTGRLHRTFDQFAVVNQLVGAWAAAYQDRLRPVLRAAQLEGRPATLLDVGCGGGDVARRLVVMAARDRLPLRVTAIDPDPRAVAYTRTRAMPPNVEVLEANADDFAAEGRRFDLVVSNHVLHHLPAAEIPRFLGATSSLAVRLVLHADLRRNALALPAFSLLAAPFRRSFVREDGLRSIRRAFTPPELRRLAPPGWRVEPVGPFRQWAVSGAPEVQA